MLLDGAAADRRDRRAGARDRVLAHGRGRAAAGSGAVADAGGREAGAAADEHAHPRGRSRGSGRRIAQRCGRGSARHGAVAGGQRRWRGSLGKWIELQR